MARLIHQQWQSFIVEFEASGLTQTDFCKERNLNSKYFSLKRSKLMVQKATDTPPFSRVVVTKPMSHSDVIEFFVGKITIKVPIFTPADYVAAVIRALVYCLILMCDIRGLPCPQV
jgi:hypothetical protein